MLPDDSFDRIYVTEDFGALAHEIDPKYNMNRYRGETRLLFPMRDRNGILFGVNSRTIGKTDMPRYITLRVPNRADLRVYGADRFDISKPGYITEGPLDSEFLPNAMAFVGMSSIKPYGNWFDIEKTTIVLDNDSRNRDVCRTLNRFIENGFRVCVWPNSFSFKDINEAVISGIDPESVQKIIDENTASGLKARAKFSNWKAVAAI